MQQISTSQRRRSGEAGFSIIEVAIASLVLLFIAIGILPIFTMAIQSNLEGQDSTKVANFARQRLERAMQLPFDHADLTLVAGTDHQICDFYEEDTDTWSAPEVGCASWDAFPVGTDYRRRMTVEQYQMTPFIEAMENGDPLPALDSSAPAGIVQFKQIVVEVESTRTGGILGGGKTLTVRAFKTV